MAHQGYYDWIAAGKPYTLIRPAKALQAKLRTYGLTVYDYPDEDHQKANTPQDHTPYSVTGYPGTNARWKARALDIMPRGGGATYAQRKEAADIARQLIRDRNAGHPGVAWIKYINWTDEHYICRQERWTPNHTTSSSADKGHTHVSGRSDMDSYTGADSYDPVARMLNLASGDNDMNAEQDASLSRVERILTAMCTRLMVDPGAGESADRKGIIINPWPNGPTVVPNPIAWLMGEFQALSMGGVDTEALAADIAGRIIAADTNTLTDADKPVIVAAVKDALKQGTE